MMDMFDRFCDRVLTVFDKLHIFRRSTLEHWQEEQHEAEIGIKATRAANERDLTLMSPEDRRRLPNRIEEAYLHRKMNGGPHG